ncbi:MAG: hypothetical protein ACYTEZ_05010 [Planctomycetota bacterium]|jgi:hypothetical protein
MKPLLVLLVLAAATLADEAAVRAALDREDFAAALRLSESALQGHPDDGKLRYLRAQALAGLARDRQRERGYAAALDFLESRLTHPVVTDAFAETCLWAGEEERALRALRASEVALADRIRMELEMLRSLGRFRGAERRAREVGWPEAEAWYRKKAAYRERLAGRARRAAWVAVGAGLTILAAAAVLFMRAPPPARRPGGTA